MTLIQVILVAALTGILVSYFRWFRNAALDKIFIALILLAGIVFVIFPEITNKIAHWLGVGRGADLLFYVAIVAFAYAILLLYSKIRSLEKQMAELVRLQALQQAEAKVKDEKHA
jgi:small membrane protein